MLARVHREQCEAGLEADVRVLDRLKVVGVGAVQAAVALFENTETRVGHHRLRVATTSRHLANGLLREKRNHRRVTHRTDVTRGRKTETVTETE